MQGKGCLACCPEGPEGRVMLLFLRKALIRLNRDYQPDFSETSDSRLLNDLAFPRLLTMLFHRPRLTTAFPSLPCLHSRFSRYLRRKLRCDAVTFNGLCSQLIQTMAERNYHLSVLEVQIKSALATSNKIASNPAYSGLIARVLATGMDAQMPFRTEESHVIANAQQIHLKQATSLRIATSSLEGRTLSN